MSVFLKKLFSGKISASFLLRATCIRGSVGIMCEYNRVGEAGSILDPLFLAELITRR